MWTSLWTEHERGTGGSLRDTSVSAFPFLFKATVSRLFEWSPDRLLFPKSAGLPLTTRELKAMDPSREKATKGRMGRDPGLQ